jgi:capsular exopolysaccharide synthesis family protein
MQNEMTTRSQQNNETQSIDIKQLVFIFLSHWYLFLIGVILALAVGYVINRFMPNVYQTSGTVLIRDANAGYDATAIMTSSAFSGSQVVDNEVAILKSYNFTDRVVRKMNLEVTYMEKGRVSKVELYKTSPFTVNFDRNVPQAVGLVYEVVSISDGKMVIHGTAEGLNVYDYNTSQYVYMDSEQKVDVTTECKLGEMVDNGYNRFSIVMNENYNPDTDNNRKLSFWLNSYSSLVRQMSTFSVSPTSKQSSIISVVARGYNKKKIVDFINTLLNEYVSRGLEKKNWVSESTIEFIDNELEGIQEVLSAAEIDLKDFREENDVIDISMQASQIYTNLRALEKQRSELAVNLKIYKRLQDYIKVQIDDPENLAAPSTMGIVDPLLNGLANDLVTMARAKSAQLLTQTEEHPQVIKLNEQIVTTKKALLENVNNLVENAKMGLAEIERQIAVYENESSKLPKKQQELINYQRNFHFSEDTYKYLMQRRAEAQILKASNMPDNEILDEARLERIVKISPRTAMNYLVALILGLLIPALYLFLKDFFNMTIKDRKDVEKLTSFPIIGQVAQTSSTNPLVVINSPKSPIAESFRSVRTNIEFLTQGKTKSTILVTGDMQSVGKTFCSINIASIYAFYGKKTVLLGFDLRKPKLFQEFELSNSVGITSFLSNKEPLDKIIQKPTMAPNLDIITSGPIPPNPAELIASEKCDEFFSLLKERYDYIIIDTPPLGLVTDSFLLMRFADVKLFIVRQGVTNKNIFGSIIKDLEDRKMDMSIVINGIETNKGYYGKTYGNYRYGYGYAYGYGYGKYGSKEDSYYGSDYYGEGNPTDKKKHRSKKEKEDNA